MSKCLRCGATSEWIQGKVPDEPAPESQWRDIETAPKDGTYMLMGAPNETPWIGCWASEINDPDVDYFVPAHWETDGEGFACSPTHWMPLPAPPTEEDKG